MFCVLIYIPPPNGGVGYPNIWWVAEYQSVRAALARAHLKPHVVFKYAESLPTIRPRTGKRPIAHGSFREVESRNLGQADRAKHLETAAFERSESTLGPGGPGFEPPHSDQTRHGFPPRGSYVFLYMVKRGIMDSRVITSHRQTGI